MSPLEWRFGIHQMQAGYFSLVVLFQPTIFCNTTDKPISIFVGAESMSDLERKLFSLNSFQQSRLDCQNGYPADLVLDK